MKICLPTMRKGEISWYKIAPKYHYYSENQEIRLDCTGNILIKPDQELMLKIHLVDFNTPFMAKSNLDYEGRIQFLKEKRQKGNIFFEKKKFEKAFKQFKLG